MKISSKVMAGSALCLAVSVPLFIAGIWAPKPVGIHLAQTGGVFVFLAFVLAMAAAATR